jgi:TRAP-type C4-dicarboxylate transport system permease small subunit
LRKSPNKGDFFLKKVQGGAEMSHLNKILNYVTNIFKWIATILLFIMLVITFCQVVLRYVFNNPTSWAGEFTLVMLIWFGFISIAIGVWEKKHMAIEFLYNKFNKLGRKILVVIHQILMAGFSALMVYYGFQLIMNAAGKIMPASQISRTLLYIPLLLSGILIFLYSIFDLIYIFYSNDEGVN